jgi:glycosyltransferase involved in cell wall biosynthesis
MSELVSILIPAYNAERWLADTIRSALGQTWSKTEVIVVDDGSQDGTLAVARAFESGSVKVVSQPNSGAPAARNKALELAQGGYIQWLDADDLLAPGKVAAQMRVAEEVADRRLLLSGAFGTFYHETSRAKFVKTSLWRDVTPLEYFLVRFCENTCFQTDAWLVSRELTEAAGPWTDFHSPDDDGEYFCRVVMKSTGVRFVEEARSYYRVGNSGSLGNRRSHRATAALFTSKAKCIRYLLELENTPRTRDACLHLLHEWTFHFRTYDDILAEAEALANELGGSLTLRPLPWKYLPIQWVFGYDATVEAMQVLRNSRSRMESSVDRLRYNFATSFRFKGSPAGASTGHDDTMEQGEPR